MLPAESTVAAWLDRIRDEYLEVPGLHLTRRQVQRLSGLEPVTCEALLSALIDANVLRLNSQGAYVRAEVASGHIADASSLHGRD